MTRKQVAAMLRRLRIRIGASTPHGVTIVRTQGDAFPPSFREVWRIEPYSEIGLPGCFVLRQLPRGGRLGPYSALYSLERMVRAWRRWEA